MTRSVKGRRRHRQGHTAFRQLVLDKSEISAYLEVKKTRGDASMDAVHPRSVVLSLGVLIASSVGVAFATPPPIVFDAARHTLTGGDPVAVVAADFNGDGRPDLAVSSNSSRNVSILLGRGDGTFSAVTPAILTPDYSPAIAAADFNGDGNQDLVQADYSGKSVVVAFGNGAGLFGPANAYDAGMAPVFVAIGDFNGDHKPDIMAGGEYFGVSVLLNLGNGAFATRTIVYPDQPAPFFGGHSAYVVGDMDGDGLDDIMSAGYTNCCGELSGQGSEFYRSLGNGTFASSFVDGTNWPVDLGLVDWDRDGRRDVAILGAGPYIRVNLNLGGGAFSAPGPILPVPDASYAMAAADFNGDGVPDVALGQATQKLIVLQAGLGDGTLGPNQSLTLADTFQTGDRIVVADFNGDNLPDLAVAEDLLGSIAVYLNLSTPPPRSGEAAEDPDLIQVTGYDPGTGLMSITYGPACQATGHSVVLGDIFAPERGTYSSMVCGIGTSGSASFDPGSGSVFFLVVGDNGAYAGSYGRNSQGIERPAATGLGVCDYPQAVGSCP
jgi:hypothetical protein